MVSICEYNPPDGRTEDVTGRLLSAVDSDRRQNDQKFKIRQIQSES